MEYSINGPKKKRMMRFKIKNLIGQKNIPSLGSAILAVNNGYYYAAKYYSNGW